MISENQNNFENGIITQNTSVYGIILDEIKARQSLQTNSKDYQKIAENIDKAVKEIILRQEDINKIDPAYSQKGIIPKALNSVSVLFSKPKERTFEGYFSDQLQSVKTLNTNLAQMSILAENGLLKTQAKIKDKYIHAKKLIEKRQERAKELESKKETYEQTRSELAKLDKNKSSYYDTKDKYMNAEYDLLEILNKDTILATSKDKNDQSADILEKHLMFYRGMIFSAKRLAVTTHYICENLEILIEDVTQVNALNNSMNRVYEGIDRLRENTFRLQEMYADANKTINRMREPNTPLQIDTTYLDDSISDMMDDMKEGHERYLIKEEID